MIFQHNDDIIKWKHFWRYWPFVRGIHPSPVNSSHKGHWRGGLMFVFYLIFRILPFHDKSEDIGYIVQWDILAGCWMLQVNWNGKTKPAHDFIALIFVTICTYWYRKWAHFISKTQWLDCGGTIFTTAYKVKTIPHTVWLFKIVENK